MFRLEKSLKSKCVKRLYLHLEKGSCFKWSNFKMELPKLKNCQSIRNTPVTSKSRHSAPDLLPSAVTASDSQCQAVSGSRLLWWRWRRLPTYPPYQGAYKQNRWAQRKRGKFGSWGPSSLFRHSLFSPSKNTSEAASLPAHGASEFHSLLLSAAQSDQRSCLIYCTSR